MRILLSDLEASVERQSREMKRKYDELQAESHSVGRKCRAQIGRGKLNIKCVQNSTMV
jgi:cell division protein FtsL